MPKNYIKTKMPKNYIKTLSNIFYELAPLTRDVICSKRWRAEEKYIAINLSDEHTL